jgi:hypothetical protein
MEVTVPNEIFVVAITRDDTTFMPTLGVIFLEKDVIHLAVTTSSMDRLKALLGLV